MACKSTKGEWSKPGQPPNLCPSCGEPMPVRTTRTAYFARRELERLSRLRLWRDIEPDELARLTAGSSKTKRAGSAAPSIRQPRIGHKHEVVTVVRQ